MQVLFPNGVHYTASIREVGGRGGSTTAAPSVEVMWGTFGIAYIVSQERILRLRGETPKSGVAAPLWMLIVGTGNSLHTLHWCYRVEIELTAIALRSIILCND